MSATYFIYAILDFKVAIRDSFLSHFSNIEAKAIISKGSHNGFKSDYSNKDCPSFSSFVWAILGLCYVPLLCSRKVFAISTFWPNSWLGSREHSLCRWSTTCSKLGSMGLSLLLPGWCTTTKEKESHGERWCHQDPYEAVGGEGHCYHLSLSMMFQNKIFWSSYLINLKL